MSLAFFVASKDKKSIKLIVQIKEVKIHIF